METFNHVVVVLCALYLIINPTVNATRKPWTTAQTRRIRAANSPAPIDCRVGRWSSWTRCDSCTDKTSMSSFNSGVSVGIAFVNIGLNANAEFEFLNNISKYQSQLRFRHLEKPAQFGGTDCVGTLWDRLACPTATTQCMVKDYCGESFTCKETGRCISQSLRCNGEPDCDNFSDEDECDRINQREDKCSTLIPIPGAERGTQGYNLLTGDFMDQVLDPKYFGGKCEYVYNGEWSKLMYDAFCESLQYNEDEKNYRKPYNYHTYSFVAEATSKGSDEYFEDMLRLLEARQSMLSFNFGVSVGIAFVNIGLNANAEFEFLNNISKYQSQDFSFIRVWSKVQTAHFKMRSNQLMLHEDFYIALMELPEQYDFGVYSRFLNTFGTHYVTEGTMGGSLEYVAVLNKTAMAKSNIDAKRFQSCFGASLGISYPISETEALGVDVKASSCENNKKDFRANSSESAVVEDIIKLVKGGITATGSGLLVIRDQDTYRKWGASLKYNPALTDFEILPIFEAVRLSTAADHAGARIDNLERAIEEYVQEFDTCRCAPCRHNGIPVLSGTSCRCICKPGFRGLACEETLRRDAKTDGSWSCWGSWSSCSSGMKSRTRVCNNPSPEGGGAPCLGSANQNRRC